MRKMSLTLAMLATVAMVVQPITSSNAQGIQSSVPMPKPKPSITKPIDELTSIVESAKRGEVAVLTQAQMTDLAASNPELHAKLSALNRDGSSANLTAEEKRLVSALTLENLAGYKAGNGPAPPPPPPAQLALSNTTWANGACIAVGVVCMVKGGNPYIAGGGAALALGTLIWIGIKTYRDPRRVPTAPVHSAAEGTGTSLVGTQKTKEGILQDIDPGYKPSSSPLGGRGR